MEESQQTEGIQEFEEGPFLATAVFCERVLREQDGGVSLIRIVDRLDIDVKGLEIGPIKGQLILFLTFKTGNANGEYEMSLIKESPSGERAKPQHHPIKFDGSPNTNRSLTINLQATFDEAGVWYFVLLLNGKQITKIPFEIRFLGGGKIVKQPKPVPKSK